VNILFWLLVSALIVIAVVIIVWPLWRKTELEASDADQRNIRIARQRLADLKAQREDGALTDTEFEEQLQELELTLSDELDSFQQSTQPVRQGRWIVPLVVLFVPVLSLSLYFWLGDNAALYKTEQQELVRQKQQETEQNVTKMVAGLAQRLQQQPDDLEGWVMLGRSYKYMKQYEGAAAAFAQAYRLAGDDVGVMLQFADALAMQQGGSLVGAPTELIFKALELSPDDVTGLWLGGMAKAEAGDFDTAMKYWQKLESLLPQNSESHQELLGLIGALQAKIQETTAPPAQAVNIKVTVNLAESLANKVQPGHTVFVYAQALRGPKMPLAIIRKQVADLPISVELNDSMAMTPAMKLSSFDQVKVIARVSASGGAMQQPGDLIGSAELKSMSSDTAVHISIDQEVQ
jgi:cytochrome c-type biogenesis protein CcmH